MVVSLIFQTRNLKYLDLSGCVFEHQAFWRDQHLEDFEHNLTYLNLSKCAISEANLAWLLSVFGRGLKHLDLSLCGGLDFTGKIL